MTKAQARALDESRWLTMHWMGERLSVRGEFVGAEAKAVEPIDTDARAVAQDDAVAEIDGLAISSETARRLCCDARIQDVVEYGGVPIGIGHVSRNVTHPLGRELARRDQGCRFPGCERRGWVHAHHIWHWGKGGPTDLGNLVQS